jgi:hypothetical protein
LLLNHKLNVKSMPCASFAKIFYSIQKTTIYLEREREKESEEKERKRFKKKKQKERERRDRKKNDIERKR